MLRCPPKISAHTAAGGPKGALRVAELTGLDLRT
jgi:hypothetical protein